MQKNILILFAAIVVLSGCKIETHKKEVAPASTDREVEIEKTEDSKAN